MFSLRDLSFVLCSRDLDVYVRKGLWVFILITHKSIRSDDMESSQIFLT